MKKSALPEKEKRTGRAARTMHVRNENFFQWMEKRECHGDLLEISLERWIGVRK